MYTESVSRLSILSTKVLKDLLVNAVLLLFRISSGILSRNIASSITLAESCSCNATQQITLIHSLSWSSHTHQRSELCLPKDWCWINCSALHINFNGWSDGLLRCEWGWLFWQSKWCTNHQNAYYMNVFPVFGWLQFHIWWLHKPAIRVCLHSSLPQVTSMEFYAVHFVVVFFLFFLPM